MDLSICLVPLNALVYLEPLLASIEQHTIGLSYEVIMVDNGSTDGTLEWVKEHHPEIQLIRNQANLGFTRGNNQAMALAKGDFLLLLNPDTLLTEDCFVRRSPMRENPNVAITIPKVLRRQFPSIAPGMPARLRCHYFLKQRLFKNRALNGYLQSASGG